MQSLGNWGPQYHGGMAFSLTIVAKFTKEEFGTPTLPWVSQCVFLLSLTIMKEEVLMVTIMCGVENLGFRFCHHHVV